VVEFRVRESHISNENEKINATSMQYALVFCLVGENWIFGRVGYRYRYRSIRFCQYKYSNDIVAVVLPSTLL
jgi:hypothetical protein